MNAPTPVFRPGWPRLLGEVDAAAYLSIGASTLRARGPAPKHVGRRKLYDIRDLDRWADALGDQPLSESDAAAEAREVERRFFEGRGKRSANG